MNIGALVSCIAVAVTLGTWQTARSDTSYATIDTNLIDFPGSVGGQPIGDLLKIGFTYYGITTSNHPSIYPMSFPVLPGQPQRLATIPGTPTALVGYADAFTSTTTLYSMESSGRLDKLPLVQGGHLSLVGFLGDSSFDDGFTPGTPRGSLVTDGAAIYGATPDGGTGGAGVVYKMNLDGSGSSVLHDFATGGGASPNGGLASIGGGSPASGGGLIASTTLYGTTSSGGAFGDGTIFKVNIDGTGFQVLHDFNGTDGANPLTGLTAIGTSLFGTTSAGGNANDGTVFNFNTLDNSFHTMHSFTGADGAHPMAALANFPLVIEGGGYDPNPPIFAGTAIVGTTFDGGEANKGTLFYMQLDGTFHSLYSFHGPDGANPMGPVLWTGPFGSTVLGTTMNGGANGAGTVFSAEFVVPEPASVVLALLAVMLAGAWSSLRRGRATS